LPAATRIDAGRALESGCSSSWMLKLAPFTGK
jgi:hypothetical protein